MDSHHIIANPLEAGSDELERYALEECVKRQRLDHRATALVMPAGRCELALKLARVGARVTAADHASHRQEVEGRVLAAGLRDEVTFMPWTLPDLPDDPAHEPYDIIVVRRELCALPYDQACQIVRGLLQKLKIGGKLYVSVFGLHSELVDGYASAEAPVEARFSPLSPPLAKKYEIGGPVCLYTERNLFMLLLDAGASVLRTLTSTYGNVKGIAVRV